MTISLPRAKYILWPLTVSTGLALKDVGPFPFLIIVNFHKLEPCWPLFPSVNLFQGFANSIILFFQYWSSLRALSLCWSYSLKQNDFPSSFNSAVHSTRSTSPSPRYSSVQIALLDFKIRFSCCLKQGLLCLWMVEWFQHLLKKAMYRALAQFSKKIDHMNQVWCSSVVSNIDPLH
jgi:hypothetical protein